MFVLQNSKHEMYFNNSDLTISVSSEQILKTDTYFAMKMKTKANCNILEETKVPK